MIPGMIITMSHVTNNCQPFTTWTRETRVSETETDDDYVQNEIKPICSYWNYDKTTYDGGFWSSDGCKVKSTNKSHTVCQCNHLTHFAILMDVYGVHDQLSEIHQIILTVITIVCSFISCLSIIFTLLAFRFLKIIKKNREQSTTKDLTTITTHLCICLKPIFICCFYWLEPFFDLFVL